VKGGWDMDDRVGFLDEAGIDVQLVSGNAPPIYPGVDPDSHGSASSPRTS